LTLGTSETNSRKCTAKDETGAKAPNKKGVNKMYPEGYRTYCIIHKARKTRDYDGFEFNQVLHVHYGLMQEAEEYMKELKKDFFLNNPTYRRENHRFKIYEAHRTTGENEKVERRKSKKEYDMEIEEYYQKNIANKVRN